MENPWLRVPLADYETHMALPGVAQAQLLGDVFATALEELRPRSVAVVGCAGGNGFERVDVTVTPRVVAIDVNPAYVAAAQARFAGRIPDLALYAADIQAEAIASAPVELVFAGLLFEYVELDAALRNIARLLTPGGVLVAVLQQPCVGVNPVTPSPYRSLAALSPVMRLVTPAVLVAVAATCGLVLHDARVEVAGGGKHFDVLTLQRWDRARDE